MTKLQFLLLCFTVTAVTACQTSRPTGTAIPKRGMFKVMILYPAGENTSFDMDYYEQNHMPMVAGFIGKNLAFYEIDKGISGRTADGKAPFTAIGYFYVHDVAEYNKAIEQNIDTIRSDIKKYTNIQPTIQISEIKQWR